MPDRLKAPDIEEIKNLVLPRPNVYYLDNGIPVYAINMGTQDILKLEIAFYAGRPFEHKKLVSRATASLLKEGTKTRKASNIAETIDYYGGTLSVPVNLDTSNVSLFTLTKYFEELIPLVAEILTEPSFPEEELESFKKRNQQRLQVDLKRNDVLAYRKITEMIFGKDAPYGYNGFAETYNALTRGDLEKHFQKNYSADNCKIFLSGRTNEKVIELLNKYLGKGIPKGRTNKAEIAPTFETPEKIKISRPETVQTAIRIGCRMFNKHHEDFKGFYVLNTVLGGYFGSRLMANIREDKGYTYNIYSTIDSMLLDGGFYVGTEVGNEFTRPALNEIYREFEVLKKELIGAEELQMVRNYLLGNLLVSLDGPFNVSEVVKTLITEDLPSTDFEDLVEVVKTITPEEINVLANKYLKPEMMFEVVAGA